MRSIRRVLVVHPFGLGDLLFLTPTLRALRLQPTVERVDLLLGSRTSELVASNPHVDEIYVLDKDKIHAQKPLENLKDMTELGNTLKNNHYDLMIDYSATREYAFWAKFYLNIPVRVGFDYKKRGKFHTVTYPLPDGFTYQHAAEDYSDLTERVGILVENRFMEVYITEQASVTAEEKMQECGVNKYDRIVCVAPGGGESWGKDAALKRWPVEFYANFLNDLPKKFDFNRIILLGSAKEKELTQSLKKQMQGDAVDLAGELSIMEVAQVLKEAVLFIGNDGGLVHIAHALRTPLIGFYGPASPEIYGPNPPRPTAVSIYQPELGDRPCYEKFRYKKDCSCLQNLSPSIVWEKLATERFFERLYTAKGLVESE